MRRETKKKKIARKSVRKKNLKRTKEVEEKSNVLT